MKKILNWLNAKDIKSDIGIDVIYSMLRWLMIIGIAIVVVIVLMLTGCSKQQGIEWTAEIQSKIAYYEYQDSSYTVNDNYKWQLTEKLGDTCQLIVWSKYETEVFIYRNEQMVINYMLTSTLNDTVVFEIY